MAESKLREKKQGLEETVESYFWSFSRLTKKAGSVLPPETKSRWFLSGLHPELRVLLMDKMHLPVTEIFERAKLLESVNRPIKKAPEKVITINAIKESP